MNSDFAILNTLFSFLGRRLVVGSLVWIKYMDNFYYRGFVDAIDYKIHVQFYEHEGKCSFALNDHVGLVLDVTPEEVKVLDSIGLI